METSLNQDGVNTAAPRKFMKRLYRTNKVYAFLRAMLSSIADMRRGRKEGLVSGELSERIMLAVTQVNGCRYCSYFHTRVALKAGLEKSEISAALAGEFAQAPAEERPALLFAQHYAEQAGQPDADLSAGLNQRYGEAKARAILGNIRAIMLGNVWGNTFDALRFRLQGHPSGQTSLLGELAVVFGLPLMIPAAALHNLVQPFETKPGKTM